MAMSSELQNKNQNSSVMQKNTANNQEYFKEYIHVLLLGITFCIFVSIITYNPADPSSFNISSQVTNKLAEITNTFGPIGASIADWCFQVFGLGSIVFSMVFIAQLLNTFRKPKQKSRFILRIFGYPQLIACYLGLLSLILPETHFRGIDIYTGGLLGSSIAHFTTMLVGKSGAIISLSIAGLASLTLSLGIRPIATVSYLLALLPFNSTKNFVGVVSDELPENEKEHVQLTHEEIFRRNREEIKKNLSENSLKNSGQSENQIKNNPPISEIENTSSLNIINSAFSIAKSDYDSLVNLLEYHKSNFPKKNVELENQKLKAEASQIEEKLASFGVKGTVIKSQNGPVINVHEFEPAAGIKVNKVLSLQDDLTLALRAQSVLIGLQPGKSALGIEIPASIRETVSLKEIMESPLFQNPKIPLPVALGKNVDGTPLIADLSAMPHLLVAGSTGSGKSVCINSMLLSLMMSKTPRQLRLLLVDPKMLELSNYDGIGHLLMPVVTEPDKAAGALKWAIEEMERRYRLMKNYQVRNVMAFNNGIEKGEIKDLESNKALDYLPYIVVVVDELSDLMMTAPKDVEDSIQRLAQKARAAGIHLILATQRPSVDVLTGVIKANLPCRLSFQVSSRHDSRTIIENIGAERLLGKGDMLFLPPGISKVIRAQCAFVNDKEINALSNKLQKLYPTFYEANVMQDIERASQDLRQKNDKVSSLSMPSILGDNETIDENTLYDKAVEFARECGNVSTSSIQREFRIGYNRAARLMDRMIREGIVGQSEATGKPRPVLKRF
ncbi:DNA translocase FtsK [Fluviispira vulneris]|uniref:DNA translocase FtsK n=1 Tax=Fluviispira vulneris TaxID=2763012 RepID=UPI001645737B|nr:DNA translocase FtsK [Fluviispira vulneris]